MRSQLKKHYKKIKIRPVKEHQKKIKEDRDLEANSIIKNLDKELILKSKKMITNKEEKKKIVKHLDFLKHILELIENDATGFDLAYTVEKNNEIKKLVHDGIVFYNMFMQIGNKKFKDIPDKQKVDYKTFRTIEDTEKHMFMVWLEDRIRSIENQIKPGDDYQKYLEKRKAQEIKREREKLREALTHCKECGERIKSKTQKLCEKCGTNLWKQIQK